MCDSAGVWGLVDKPGGELGLGGVIRAVADYAGGGAVRDIGCAVGW